MPFMPTHYTTEKAEILALEGLGWLAADEDGFQRFLNLTGTGMEALRRAAESRETAMAVLDFLLAHEDILLRFCQSAGIDPRDVQMASHRLARD